MGVGCCCRDEPVIWGPSVGFQGGNNGKGHHIGGRRPPPPVAFPLGVRTEGSGSLNFLKISERFSGSFRIMSRLPDCCEGGVETFPGELSFATWFTMSTSYERRAAKEKKREELAASTVHEDCPYL